MGRFGKFIRGIQDIGEGDKIVETLKKDCQPYIRETQDARGWLYNGSKRNIRNIQKFKTRSNRKPRNSGKEVTKFVDDWAKKKFGWKMRTDKNKFVTSDKSEASYFGTPYLFFPIGKFVYAWSPEINDMTRQLPISAAVGMDGTIGELPIGEFADGITKLLDTYIYNDLLLKAIAVGNEVSIKCNEYYLVEEKYSKVIFKELYGY